jgi:hypothetical protein
MPVTIFDAVDNGHACRTCGAVIADPLQAQHHRCGKSPRTAPRRSSAPPAPQCDDSMPCTHRGAKIRQQGCPSCQGNVQLNVLSCATHGECCIGKTVPGVRTCRGCPDRVVAIAEPFTVKKLAVITTRYNPMGYHAPAENFKRFADGIADAGLPLYVAELALDDDPFTVLCPDSDSRGDYHGEATRVLQLRGSRARNMLWQKERLLNLLLAKLPEWDSDIDAVCVFDSDVIFPNPDWADQIRQALETNEAVQPFRDIYHLRANGRLEHIGESLAAKWLAGKLVQANGVDGCPGYAWAARAQPGGWLRTYGFRDDIIVGCGDIFQSWAMTGRRPWLTSLSPAWAKSIDAWASAVHSRVKGAVGYLPGSLLHLYHGSPRNRAYHTRWFDLIKNQFEPTTDIEIDANGLWAWTDSALRDKPALMQQLQQQFAGRREDDE